MPLSGFIVDRLGWEAMFYVFGSLSLFWAIIWFYFARESPEKMSRINSDELAYIKSKITAPKTISPKIPFKNIFLSLPYWVRLTTI